MIGAVEYVLDVVLFVAVSGLFSWSSSKNWSYSAEISKIERCTAELLQRIISFRWYQLCRVATEISNSVGTRALRVKEIVAIEKVKLAKDVFLLRKGLVKVQLLWRRLELIDIGKQFVFVFVKLNWRLDWFRNGLFYCWCSFKILKLLSKCDSLVSFFSNYFCFYLWLGFINGCCFYLLLFFFIVDHFRFRNNWFLWRT